MCLLKLYIGWSSSRWTCFRTSPVYIIMSDDNDNSIMYTFIHTLIFRILVCIGTYTCFGKRFEYDVIPLCLRKIILEREDTYTKV